MTSAALSLDALYDAVARLPDDRLSAVRRAALDHLREHGLPTTRLEDWKYTDLGPAIDTGNRALARDAGSALSADARELVARVREAIDADWLIIANGIIDDAALQDAAQDGLSVARLSETDHEPVFSTPLGGLNVALLHDGLRLQVAAAAAMPRPLGILVIDDSCDGPGMSQVRVDIELDAGSRAGIVEYHASLGAADHFTNAFTRLSIGAGAHADFVRIQERDLCHSQTSRLDVSVGRDGEFNHCGFDLGGLLVRNDLAVDIAEPGARANFSGLYLAGGRQHVDNHTRADHRVGPATSHQEYRGIVAGRARAVWNGKAIVHDGADGTDADQANHNLLLSDKAEVDAKPELEIYADDVKCSHGTTVGQLDETSLFYLRTRGLSRRQAEQVLTRAFAQIIVAKAPIEALHDMLAGKIAARLEELLEGGDE